MRTRVLIAAALLIPALALTTGCSSDNSERARVVCEVSSVNAGVPLISAYVTDGGDGVIGPGPSGTVDDKYTTDAVPVTFHARPYDSQVTSIGSDDPYSSFVITGYDLTWVPGADAPAGLDLTPYNVVNAPLYLTVPINDDASASVMVSGRAVKEAVGTLLGTPWNLDQDFTVVARIQFMGHASGDEHVTKVDAGLTVTFTFAVASN